MVMIQMAAFDPQQPKNERLKIASSKTLSKVRFAVTVAGVYD